jgi:DNA-binding transcriptional LysR family regulator
LKLKSTASQRLLPLLLNGGLDAVFCREPVLLPASYVFKPLQPDEPVIMASTRHPLAKRRGVALSALKDSRWVLPTATIAVREIFEREVLAALPDALQFPVSTVSLPVFASLLNQPDAVARVAISCAMGLGADTTASCIFLTSLVSARPNIIVCITGTKKMAAIILRSRKICTNSFFIKPLKVFHFIFVMALHPF